METNRLLLRQKPGSPSWRELGYGPWDIFERTTGAPVGIVAIALAGWPDRSPWWGVPELSLDLNESFRRRGFGTEAAAAVFDWAFRERQPPLERLWGVTFPDNAGAIALNERLGMRVLPAITQDARTDRPSDHEPVAVTVYEITAEEWVRRQDDDRR